MCDGSITTMVSNQNRIRYCWIVYCTNLFYFIFYRISLKKIIFLQNDWQLSKLIKICFCGIYSQPIAKVTRDCQRLNRNPMQSHQLRTVHKHSPPPAIYLTQRIMPKTHQAYRPKKILKQSVMNSSSSNSSRKRQLIPMKMMMIWPLYI